MTDTNLRPCPFCGCKSVNLYTLYTNSYNGKTRVKCAKCNAEMTYTTRIAAIAAWNRRIYEKNEIA